MGVEGNRALLTLKLVDTDVVVMFLTSRPIVQNVDSIIWTSYRPNTVLVLSEQQSR